MCGRFSLTTELHKLEERFFLENMETLDYSVSYNIAPGQKVLAVVQDNQQNKAGFLQWGLVPSWAKDRKIGYKMINARAETLQEKVSFKRLLERRRCLVIADSFYEWKNVDGEKRPVRFMMKNSEPFAFAGLWDRWVHGEEELVSCTIITTKPNQLVEDIHNRMPVILKKQDENRWIDKSSNDTAGLTSLFLPYDGRFMEAYEVSTLVNSPKNNGRECIMPV
jgi:putative SOS response-associated peptidase YedK